MTMQESKFSPELIKAIKEGFSQPFTLVGGLFYCDLIPGKVYAPADVSKEVRPCTVSETTIYRLQTPDGLKGYALLKWNEEQDV